MVDAKELRIGNWVSYLGSNTQINSISIGEPCGYVSTFKSGIIIQNQIEPISLTEDLLLKCGFEEKQWGDEDDPPVFYKNGLTISCKTWGKDSFYLNSYDIDVTFLHQLQNIYYALTGKELEVEL